MTRYILQHRTSGERHPAVLPADWDTTVLCARALDADGDRDWIIVPAPSDETAHHYGPPDTALRDANLRHAERVILGYSHDTKEA